MNKLLAFVRDESGLTTVEYCIAGALVSLAVVGAFTALGLQVATVINAIVTVITPV